MSNKSKQVVTKADVAKVPAEVTKPAKIQVIKVLKKDAKFRGAREAWYNELKKWDDKPVTEFEAHCKEKPPSTPTKGALAGKGEPPSGWTSYFKRTGILELVEREVKA